MAMFSELGVLPNILLDLQIKTNKLMVVTNETDKHY